MKECQLNAIMQRVQYGTIDSQNKSGFNFLQKKKDDAKKKKEIHLI